MIRETSAEKASDRLLHACAAAMLRFDYRADAPGAPFDLTLAVYHDVVVCTDRFQLLPRALKAAEDDLHCLGPASSQPSVVLSGGISMTATLSGNERLICAAPSTSISSMTSRPSPRSRSTSERSVP